MKQKDRLSFCVNFLLFAVAITALILLRIFITEEPPLPDFPSMDEIQEFLLTFDGTFYFDVDEMQSRTYFYTSVKSRPMIVVEPLNEEDIVKILEFGQKYPKWPFSIKSGGHSAGEYSINNDGLVMDLSKHFTDISWGDPDRSTIIAQGGVTWGQIYQFIDGSGKGVVGATCTTVGVAGFIQGGGISRFSVNYGLGIDYTVEINIILANGTKAVASAESNPDLFWALSGGGGGNFGVVTSVEIRTWDLVNVTLVSACWSDLSNLPSILEMWAPDLTDLNGDRVYRLYMERTPTTVRFCIDVEATNTTLEEIVDYMLPRVPNYNVLFRDHWENQFPVEIFPSYPTEYHYIKSMVLSTDAYDAEMNAVLRNAFTTLKDAPTLFLFYESFGRGVNRYSKTDTAYPHRNTSGILEMKVFWPTQFDSVLGNAMHRSANELWRQLSKWNKGAYVNYIDPLLDNWSSNYYGANYDRLKTIKTEVDPNNYFHFDQSIGSK